MTTGKIEAQAIEDNKRFGRPLPPAILNRPVLRIGLGLYYEGFFDLCSTRPAVDRPISYLAMMEYCKFWGFDIDQCELFLYYVSRLDASYLEHIGGK